MCSSSALIFWLTLWPRVPPPEFQGPLVVMLERYVSEGLQIERRLLQCAIITTAKQEPKRPQLLLSSCRSARHEKPREWHPLLGQG